MFRVSADGATILAMDIAEEIRGHLKRLRPLIVSGTCFSEYDWLGSRLSWLGSASVPEKDVRIYGSSMACGRRLMDKCWGPDPALTIFRYKSCFEDVGKHEVILKTRKRLAKHVFVLDAYMWTPTQILNLVANARDGSSIYFLGDVKGVCSETSYLHWDEMPTIAPEPASDCPRLCGVGLEVLQGIQSEGITWRVGEKIRDLFKLGTLVAENGRFVRQVNQAIAAWKRGTSDKADRIYPGDPVWFPYSSWKEGFTLGDTGVLEKILPDGSYVVRCGEEKDKLKVATRVEHAWCMPLWLVRMLPMTEHLILVQPYGCPPKQAWVYELCKATSGQVTVLANSEADLRACVPQGATQAVSAA